MTAQIEAVRHIEAALTALAKIRADQLTPEDRVEIRTTHDRLERIADRIIPKAEVV